MPLHSRKCFSVVFGTFTWMFYMPLQLSGFISFHYLLWFPSRKTIHHLHRRFLDSLQESVFQLPGWSLFTECPRRVKTLSFKTLLSQTVSHNKLWPSPYLFVSVIETCAWNPFLNVAVMRSIWPGVENGPELSTKHLTCFIKEIYSD